MGSDPRSVRQLRVLIKVLVSAVAVVVVVIVWPLAARWQVTRSGLNCVDPCTHTHMHTGALTRTRANPQSHADRGREGGRQSNLMCAGMAGHGWLEHGAAAAATALCNGLPAEYESGAVDTMTHIAIRHALLRYC